MLVLLKYDIFIYQNHMIGTFKIITLQWRNYYCPLQQKQKRWWKKIKEKMFEIFIHWFDYKTFFTVSKC